MCERDVFFSRNVWPYHLHGYIHDLRTIFSSRRVPSHGFLCLQSMNISHFLTGTRGDGTPSGMEKRPSPHRSMEDSDDGGDGIGGPSQSIWPQKRMRGWPPRGGEEELETAENRREEREGRHEGKADSMMMRRRRRRWHQGSGFQGGHAY